MSTDRRIVLFDLFGVIALHQRPGALAEMAARRAAPADAFAEAYWDCRPPYDAAQWSAPEYWTAVLRWLSLPVDADTIEELRLADIDSWSRVDHRMVAYVQSLRNIAEVALLSNIPADHADAFLAAQPWLGNLDHVAFSGKINAAKPDPATFHHCVVSMQAAPAGFLFVDDREENVRAARATGMNGRTFRERRRFVSGTDTGPCPNRHGPAARCAMRCQPLPARRGSCLKGAAPPGMCTSASRRGSWERYDRGFTRAERPGATEPDSGGSSGCRRTPSTHTPRVPQTSPRPSTRWSRGPAGGLSPPLRSNRSECRRVWPGRFVTALRIG